MDFDTKKDINRETAHKFLYQWSFRTLSNKIFVSFGAIVLFSFFAMGEPPMQGLWVLLALYSVCSLVYDIQMYQHCKNTDRHLTINQKLLSIPAGYGYLSKPKTIFLDDIYKVSFRTMGNELVVDFESDSEGLNAVFGKFFANDDMNKFIELLPQYIDEDKFF
ncbi:hypothetical protein [Neptuniibacter sp. QD34_54]|uniref:hypothetical protein n=1 Tax=Neptuniibacter sp. QD34_54 TaxID=3398208 RepID=UPI0039F49A0A